MPAIRRRVRPSRAYGGQLRCLACARRRACAGYTPHAAARGETNTYTLSQCLNMPRKALGPRCGSVCSVVYSSRRCFMNAQEHEQLSRFLQQLTQAQAGAKDTEAAALIREACARQPDAAYLLVQRAFLLEQAVQAAQAENQRLQRELASANERLESGRAASGAGSSFLSGNAWGRAAAPAPAVAAAPAHAAAAPAAPAATAASSWGSGVLGSVATTAAGVVAGSFLFQGIEHLMGGHNAGSGFFGSGNSATLPGPSTENVVVNNYYGDDAIARAESEDRSTSDFAADDLGDDYFDTV
ncbi:DUF2076 family protein [Rhodocyclus tenuis]|uniref:DUF2076 family protein n=2 Tax=Rhodocyclus TaxID=1064 RepID=A0A6L5JVN2_RHOTE|nr:DUF2076 family protein [Rhodocyclus gracilis]